MSKATRISQSIVTGAIVLALLAGLNVLAYKNPARWDATVDKRHSLAAETRAALNSLEREVTAAAFFRPQEPGRQRVADLLALFARESDKFSYEFVDPDRSPFQAREAGVGQTGAVVLFSGERKENVIFPDEEKLVNALVRVSDVRARKTYFVTGHGEAADTPETGAALLRTELADQGAAVEDLTLARLETVPDDADLVVVLGPRTDYLDHELQALSAYLQSGGRLLAAVAAEHRTTFDGWLESELGLVRREGYVVDPVSRLFTGDPMSPMMQTYGSHPITRDFNLLTIFPTASALEPANPEGGTGVRSLGSSAEQAWLETDLAALREGVAEFDEGEDAPGPLWLGAVYETPPGGDGGRPGRAVVFADQDFLTDQYLNLSGNLDLARNTANWLLEREGLISVSKPAPASVFLTLSPGGRVLLAWLPLLGMPSLMVVLAVFMALRRRAR